MVEVSVAGDVAEASVTGDMVEASVTSVAGEVRPPISLGPLLFHRFS